MATIGAAYSYLNFNSIKVRLELGRDTKDKVEYSYFNSIKVRLEHNTSIVTVNSSTFQFHKGAIRTVETIT